MNFLDDRLPARFWDKVQPCPMSGCWLWTGSADQKGYGRIGMGSKRDGTRKPRCAHRVAYAALVGPIPPGLMLDHLCRQPGCVNPAHLEPVTNAVNVARGVAGVNQLAKTHCPRGHEYSGDNLVMQRNAVGRGARVCRVCKNAANAEYIYRQANHISLLRPCSAEALAVADALLVDALSQHGAAWPD